LEWHLTCENTQGLPETSSLIYFYSSYLNADNGDYVKLYSEGVARGLEKVRVCRTKAGEAALTFALDAV
jgi:hypothetical protein